MPQVQVYVSIPLPVDEVFYFLSDGRNLARWHSGVMDIRPEGPEGADGAGHAERRSYSYRFPGRHRDFRLECCAYEHNVRIGFIGQRMWNPLGSQMPRYDFRVWPQGTGCRVGVQVTSWLTGGMLLLWPIVALGWRRDLPEDAQRLHELLTGSEELADVGHEPGPLVIADRPRRRHVRRLRQPATHA
ncbi:SRPBCC family protein [Streptomyces sp. OF3]|uniref:SRPBCC family protein n=1 Tax=Streptomyces alkaliterrae TaxID=2213162 RepID=A0A7W3WPJ7_9ACTN|nr:SRPBCC family protein [Streptomyces alkaliterrae]MBB1256159.1 SRPBCC family protein [Streptomyces alkaliterrae]MBB1261753.1 SRPBCC family protein [Streptomyces alkaliterrae]